MIYTDPLAVVADYRQRFREGPVGFWYTHLGGGFEMTHGSNYQFNADGTGTFWSWGGGPPIDEFDEEVAIEWASVGDRKLKARKAGESEWEFVAFDFLFRRDGYDHPKVCIFQPDHRVVEDFGEAGFWWSAYPLVHDTRETGAIVVSEPDWTTWWRRIKRWF
ncbi:MAG: hypothetical protein WED34_10865 [Planctomycetales bacterium]